MDIRPIRNETDLKWALAEIEQYFENEPELGTPEGDRFQILTTLIEAYEDEHYPLGPIDTVEFLGWFMDMTGKTKRDLIEVAGSEARADEILAGRGGLTLEIAYRLNSEWKVPADILVKAGKRAA